MKGNYTCFLKPFLYCSSLVHFRAGRLCGVAKYCKGKPILNMDEIIKRIQLNKQLVGKIERMARTIQVPDDNQKAMVFSGFLQDAISHFLAMNILIEKGLYNSAFALVRIFFDTLIRGQYMVYIIDASALNEMYLGSKDWQFPKTKAMCLELDKFFEENIFEKIRKNSYGQMCDYTHIGKTQIARHFHESTALIKPNFEEILIIDTLEGSYALMDLFANNFQSFMQATGLLASEIDWL